MRVAAYQAPYLPFGSFAAVALIRGLDGHTNPAADAYLGLWRPAP